MNPNFGRGEFMKPGPCSVCGHVSPKHWPDCNLLAYMLDEGCPKLSGGYLGRKELVDEASARTTHPLRSLALAAIAACSLAACDSKPTIDRAAEEQHSQALPHCEPNEILFWYGNGVRGNGTPLCLKRAQLDTVMKGQGHWAP
jgi:hypothetical protein